ncbi:MAG: hypothetical protein HFH82_13910 [Lachnospiraceae bacterium]|nr:hypothetical protein [Lachnospiraceae bacterium]
MLKSRDGTSSRMRGYCRADAELKYKNSIRPKIPGSNYVRNHIAERIASRMRGYCRADAELE